ncbi:MarR family winged helix-turn-helix transcriptional regulator [Kribbella sp. CA-293567]|uniref:MarR family winged helix-turn-helix transcriptional regulator n=1 Tax=Kribbella sp. CA-293567 TaxID=3002436 RepID=UPI0022DE78A9|nr:MarR family transcriptional regulator [Kribbella sp. CA-293567]WBQ04368.1 MarR family transcriptional regulator [Kribbella sp. CA-293567]
MFSVSENLDHVARIQAAWQAERPDLDVSPQGVIGRLHRIAAQLTCELNAVYAKYGVTEGEFDVLAALRRAGAPYERAPGEIALHTMVTTGAVSKRVDRLEKAGLVHRRRSAVDGRGRMVRLTPAGKRLIDKAFTAHIANEHRLVEYLTSEEADQLEAVLTSWLARIEPTG